MRMYTRHNEIPQRNSWPSQVDAHYFKCDFESGHRDNVHQAIRCNLRSVHYGARMIMTRTQDAMKKYLIAEPEKHAPEETAHVIPFKNKSNTKND